MRFSSSGLLNIVRAWKTDAPIGRQGRTRRDECMFGLFVLELASRYLKFVKLLVKKAGPPFLRVELLEPFKRVRGGILFATFPFVASSALRTVLARPINCVTL